MKSFPKGQNSIDLQEDVLSISARYVLGLERCPGRIGTLYTIPLSLPINRERLSLAKQCAATCVILSFINCSFNSNRKLLTSLTDPQCANPVGSQRKMIFRTHYINAQKMSK